MPRAALTTEELEAQRERLCATAARLFAREGYATVTMRGIGKEAGLSHAAVYRYFPGKEALFQRVRAQAFVRFAEHIQSAAAGCTTANHHIERVGLAYVEFALNEPSAYHLMFSMNQGRREDFPALAAASDYAFDQARTAARVGVEQGLLSGEIDTLAHELWATLHGLVSLHLADVLTMGRSLPELMRPMLRSFIQGNR